MSAVLAIADHAFRATFEQAEIGIAHSSPEGRFLRVNRKFCDMLGFSEQELQQRTSVDITHPADVADTRERMSRVLRGESVYSQLPEKRYVRKDGTVLWVMVAVSLVRDERGQPAYFITALQDITERKRSEALTRLEHVVARCLAGTDAAPVTLKAVIRAICESEGWEFGHFWHVDAAAGVLRAREAWSVPDAGIENFIASSGSETFASGLGWVGRIWKSGEPQWIADISKDDRLVLKTLVGQTGLRAVFAFPVVAEGATIGVLCFASREMRQPDARLLATAHAIGSQVGQYLRSNEAEEKLRRFRAAMDVSADLVFLIDPVTLRYVDANDAACHALGYTHAEVVGMGPLDIFSATREQLTSAYAALVAGDLGGTAVEGEYRCKDGSRLLVESFRRAVPSGGGHVIVGVARDISERKKGEEALRRFRAAMDATSDAIYLTDRSSMSFIDVNEAACRMLGVTREELMRQGPTGVLAQSREELESVYDSVIAGGRGLERVELMRERKDGKVIWVELKRRALHSADGWMIISVVRNITERKKLEEHLQQQANYDSLTRLPNRALCYDRLRQALIQSRRKATSTSLLFVDLDRFKAVNDTLGHGAGDLLLQQVGQRLASSVRAGDTVGRLGGDEFVIVLPEVADARDAGLIARKAIEALALPFLLGEHEASISASIGIASYPQDGDSVEALIRNADAAMFSAKEAGRNAFRFYTPEVKVQARLAAPVEERQAGEITRPRARAALEEALRKTEEELRRFRLAMDYSADMILLIDRATMRYVDVNPAVTRLLGYSREELLGLGPQDILPVSLPELEASYDQLIGDPSVKGAMDSYYICKDGSHLPFESTRHVLRSGNSWIIAAISRDIRERLATERSLLENERRFRQTFELAASGMAHVGLDDRFIRVNQRLCDILGYSEAELIGRKVTDLSHPDDLAMTIEKRASVRSKKLASAGFEKRYLRKDGTILWASISVALACDAAGVPLHDILVLEDVTERRLQQERIERLTRVHAVLSGINGAIVRIRDRAELFREACRIAVSAGGFAVARVIELDTDGKARVAATTEADGAVFEDVVAQYNRDPLGAASLLAQSLRSGEAMVSNHIVDDVRVQTRTALTEKGTFALAVLPLTLDKRRVGVITLRAREAGMFDADEMKLLTDLAGDISFALGTIEKEKRLDYLALYDALTGLANRTLFVERLNQSIHAAASSNAKFAVVLTDIERLRTVNESLGRQAGDELLTQVAGRIIDAAGRTEAARVAADQFVMVLPTVKGRSEAGRIVQALARSCFSAPFVVHGAEIRVAAKTGIALYPSNGADAETLIKRAEAALRKGKATGEPFTFYTPDLAERTGGTLSLETKLRQAMDKEEFVLHYQTKVDAESRRIAGVEALIRWQSPELGLVPPMKFIPLMEETGMILEVGAWALARAAKDHQRWIDLGVAAPRVAVNVSAIQLRKKDFLDTVKGAAVQGRAPVGVDLEITESLVMEDIEGNIEKLKAVRALGASIAIDDFGTGYSSLAYLAKLPVQTLKIDRSFVMTMLNDPDTMTLVQTIISLAHSLRLKVVAEGVDSEAQAKVLRLLRCDEMQGYLFSQPAAFEAITPLLAKPG